MAAPKSSKGMKIAESPRGGRATVFKEITNNILLVIFVLP